MRKYLLLVLATAAILATQIAAAQKLMIGPSERDMTKAINGAGHACSAIVSALPGEILSNRDLLVIVSCETGAKHVLRITPENRLSYHAPCSSERELCERRQKSD